MALVSFSSLQMAKAESEAKPSAAAKKKFEDRMQLKYATQVAQINSQWDASKVVINFVPETPYATQFLSKKVEVFISDDRGKVKMTAEAAMQEYLKQFDRAMSNAKKFEVSRGDGFADVSHKVNAKAFDEAVGRARLAMSRYRLLQAELRHNLFKSFGPLRDLVSKDDMKLLEQGKKLPVSSMADLVQRMDFAGSDTWIATDELQRKGATSQYNELRLVQTYLKSSTPNDPAVQPKRYLNDTMDIVRQVEAKGVEVARKATVVDVANFNRMAPDHKQALETAKMRQPVSLQVQRALDKIPRSQIAGGRVTLVVGAIGFVASGAVVAGEAEAVETKAAEGTANFNRGGWARSVRPTSQ